jgi:hypothetical protein
MSTLNTCTSSTRPGSPSAGDTLFETDTNKIIVYDGSAFKEYDSDAVGYTSTGEHDLNYPGGLFTDTSATYYVSTQPDFHFDASILDGTAAANNPTSNASVTAFGDRSGNGQDTTQTSASLQPTFHTKPFRPYEWVGNCRLNFDSSYSVTGAGTFFAVAQRFGGHARLFDTYDFVSLGEGPASGTDTTFKVFGLATSGTHDTYTRPVMVVGSRDSSNNVTGWLNGGSSVLSATKSNTFVLTTIGRSAASDTMIFELMYFDTDLSLADMNVVREYLSNKYAFLSTTAIT